MNLKYIIKIILKDRTLLYLIYVFFTVSFIILVGSLDNYFEVDTQ